MSEFEDQMRKAQVEKNRKERKTREGFKVCVTLISHSATLTHGEVRLQAFLQEFVEDRLSTSGMTGILLTFSVDPVPAL